MANIRKILMQVAAAHHTTVAEVRTEIETAIDEGMKSTDSEVQKRWRSMSRTGGKPTLEEAIIAIIKETMGRMSKN